MGAAYSELFPPKPTFSVDDIPDLAGRVAIVTGGYSGVGKWTAKALVEHNAKVYIAGRDEKKAQAAMQWLKQETGKDAHFLQLDLSSLKRVKEAAETFLSQEKELHMLFNNAGVMFPPIEQLTADGYDLQWGTNVLGHFYFTKLLVPALTAGAKSMPDGCARVMNTSSSASGFGAAVDFNAFKDGPRRKSIGTYKLYGQSKLGNVLFSNEFARRHKQDGIVSCAMNPGNLETELQRHLGPVGSFFVSFILHPTPFGALTQLWAGTTANGAQVNGAYLRPWARMGQAPQTAMDEKLAGEVWAWCEEQVKDI